MFADTHVHFHFPEFDADREQAIQAARQAGVELFINVGTDVKSSEASLKLAQQYPDFYASAGLHPHEASQSTPAMMQQFEKMLSHPRVVAIGEVGLDFFRDHSPQDKQIQVFKDFIRLHKKTGKPLIMHCRDAYEKLIEILKSDCPARGAIHCFSSDRPMMQKLADMGLYISFAGPLTYKKNDALREACRHCPIDQLLFETDAPFLPPQSKRGQRNESKYMIETLQVAAKLRGMSLQELGEKTTANARKILAL